MVESVTVRDLEPGDEVLWGDRKEPLEVQESEVHVNQENIEGVLVESTRGTKYVLREDIVGNPKVLRDSGFGPDRWESNGYAENLRRVE